MTGPKSSGEESATTTSVGSLKSDAFADGVSKFAGTLDDDGEVSLTFADSVTGYSSEEDDDTATVSSVKVSAEQPAWTRDWGPVVVKLIQDKGILSTGNREFAVVEPLDQLRPRSRGERGATG